jgi:hypothetical protein
MQCLIEAHFLPSLEYFCALHRFDKIFLETHEHFNKQSYRNRCYVLTSQGPKRITIPVVATHQKILITNVKVDYTTRWQQNLLRKLESAYAKAPYFEHYMDDLKKEILRGHEYLYDLDVALLSMCLQWLRWELPVSGNSSFEKSPPTGTKDLRDQILAKKDFGAREFYHPHPYQQVFGNNFVPNLSMVDLVFCTGPNAAAVIRSSQNKI